MVEEVTMVEVKEFLTRMREDGVMGLCPKYFLAEGGYVNDSRYLTVIRDKVRLVLNGTVIEGNSVVARKLYRMLNHKNYSLVPYSVARGAV